MHRLRLVLIASVAFLLSGVAAIVAYRILSSRLAPAATDKPTMIVVANKELKLGRRLAEGDLTTAPWLSANQLAGSFSAPAEIIGRGVIQPMTENEPVLDYKLAPVGAGAGLTSTIPEGMRAISVEVDDVVGVAGFVLPGCRVDVILSGSTDSYQIDTSKVILENVQVLAAGQDIEQGADGNPVSVQVITLLVTPEEAQKLSLGTVDGRIQLALRNPLDLEATNPAPIRKASLYSVGVPPKPKPTPRRVAPVRKPEPEPVREEIQPPAKGHEVEVIQGLDRERQVFQVEGSGSKSEAPSEKGKGGVR